MAWLYVAIAITFEVASTTMIVRTEGFTRPGWTVAVLSGYGVSFFWLARAVRELEIGVVYAVWSGVGTAAIVTLGVIFLGERVTAPKLAGIALIVAGVIVLNVFEGHGARADPQAGTASVERPG